MFTYNTCFSSDCGLCSSCCKDRDTRVYASPYDKAFSDYHDDEVKEVVKKAKELKENKFHNLPIHDILGKVMGVKSHTIYIPLDKRIRKIKEQIEENEIYHRLWMEELERTNEHFSEPDFQGSRTKRNPDFCPDGLPDLTPGLTNIPHQIPDYNDKNVMKKIDNYRNKYWKDMEVLKKKYGFENYESVGTIPKNVTLTERQYNKIKLPSDLTLKKGEKFKLINCSNYTCDNIQCLDMNAIYCAETRILDIPMYTEGSNYELCGLCLLGK